MPPRSKVASRENIRQHDGSTVTLTRYRPSQARDQIGHWVAPKDRKGHPCPHACCAGKRVHPDNLPTTLDRDYLHGLTPRELGEELASYVNYADRREHGLDQITAEIDRRGGAAADEVDAGYQFKADVYERGNESERASKERASTRRARQAQEWTDHRYRQWLAAESETNGYMLNKRAKRAGIDERTLFTGNAARIRRYASDELLDFFDAHPPLTREQFIDQSRERKPEDAGKPRRR
jgi:hypothetical protein